MYLTEKDIDCWLRGGYLNATGNEKRSAMIERVEAASARHTADIRRRHGVPFVAVSSRVGRRIAMADLNAAAK